jgi:hypothetical protein
MVTISRIGLGTPTIVTRKSWHEHRGPLILISVIRFAKPAKDLLLKIVRVVTRFGKAFIGVHQEISLAERTYSRLLKSAEKECTQEGKQTRTVTLKGFVVGPRQSVGR